MVILLKIIKSFSSETNKAHGLLSSRISILFLDSRGDMWLGDRGDNDYGLFKYNEKLDTFKHYHKIDTDSLTLK
jgi:hypothetical protein